MMYEKLLSDNMNLKIRLEYTEKLIVIAHTTLDYITKVEEER